jgi:hypothetical protein
MLLKLAMGTYIVSLLRSSNFVSAYTIHSFLDLIFSLDMFKNVVDFVIFYHNLCH